MSECQEKNIIITAGSNYLDIDAYACMVALAELLCLQGKRAVAYSRAIRNYSVCPFLIEPGQVLDVLPEGFDPKNADYIITDVSDPDFLGSSVPLNRVVAVYDHHAGFEDYWKARIGAGACIEFIGAAATLIYRLWQQAGLEDQISRPTTLLLIAAILDNTLNLTSHNTTEEDIRVFRTLCRKAQIGEEWRGKYFSAVQVQVEADLKNALMGDLKSLQDRTVLPGKIAQLCVWNGETVLARLSEISAWFAPFQEGWMINLIDLQQRCSYFICGDTIYQGQIAKVFGADFHGNVARLPDPWLRKEIIKKAYYTDNGGNKK